MSRRSVFLLQQFPAHTDIKTFLIQTSFLDSHYQNIAMRVLLYDNNDKTYEIYTEITSNVYMYLFLPLSTWYCYYYCFFIIIIALFVIFRLLCLFYYYCYWCRHFVVMTVGLLVVVFSILFYCLKIFFVFIVWKYK